VQAKLRVQSVGAVVLAAALSLGLTAPARIGGSGTQVRASLNAQSKPSESQDLEQARQAIDVLLVLRDKTSGNRTEQEDRLLEELVYDLQMRFVRAAGPSASRSAS